MKQAFPNAKWDTEPYNIYKATVGADEWAYQVKNRADKDELTPDMLKQEGVGTEFVWGITGNVFNSGMNITKDMVGSSQSNEVDELMNVLSPSKGPASTALLVQLVWQMGRRGKYAKLSKHH